MAGMRAFVGTCLTVSLLVAYTVAYNRALKENEHWWLSDPTTGYVSHKYPHYSFGSGIVFLPAHCIDRMLRYKFWSQGPPPPDIRPEDVSSYDEVAEPE
jgi:hypothetical protein